MGAGQLREKLTFAKPTPIDDGYGNFEEGFTDQFEAYARIQPRLGGETVLASRLAGRAVFILTVWSTTSTRQITSDWQATHSDGRVFEIKSPTRNVDEKHLYLEMDVETGVAG